MFFLSSKSGSKLISLNGLTLLNVKGKGEYYIVNPRKRNQNLKEKEGVKKEKRGGKKEKKRARKGKEKG